MTAQTHNQVTQPSSEERVWAAIAHSSVVLFGFGYVLCAALWATQRRKSAYVAFQSLQALGYQVISLTVGVVFVLLVPLLLFPLTLGELKSLSASASGANPGALPFLSISISYGLILGMLVIYVLLGIAGAALSLAGQDFKYPLLGTRLARYVSYEPAARDHEQRSDLNEEREDRWVAAMSHATVVVIMWGLLLPLVAWATEKDRSRFLRFQALQALVYQALGLVAYFAAMFLYMLGVLGLGIGMMLGASAQDPSGPALVVLIVSSLMILIFLLLLLLLPLFQILAQWAAIQILRGHDYQYPILGRWLRGRLDQPAERAAA
ncbi:MAG TPA: DUF4870 domain-containing protein [Anaerolineales bacterium]|jgi:uncharacterized Tic20 family protein